MTSQARKTHTLEAILVQLIWLTDLSAIGLTDASNSMNRVIYPEVEYPLGMER